MRRIGLAVVLAVSLLIAPLAAPAQQPGKVYRIGYLGTTAAVPPPIWDAFLLGLRELAWVEGQTIVIEQRNAEGRYERLSELAADLVRASEWTSSSRLARSHRSRPSEPRTRSPLS